MKDHHPAEAPVATDSEILGGLVSDLADGAHFRDRAGYVVQASDEEIATLRKYAAIARSIEAGKSQLVPVEPLAHMVDKAHDATDPDCNASCAEIVEIWRAMLKAAPQFQEEGKNEH